MTIATHKLSPLSKDHGALVVAPKPLEIGTVMPPQGLNEGLALNLERHRRWNTTLSRGFLDSVHRVEINETHSADGVDYFVVEVFLSLPTSRLPTRQCDSAEAPATPTFKVERRFSDFEQLREHVLAAVSTVPICTCRYCIDFLAYIRFKSTQPRSLVKLFASTDKRKQVLTAFINDFVAMGRKSADKPTLHSRRCDAQRVVPALLEAFLLDHADC